MAFENYPAPEKETPTTVVPATEKKSLRGLLIGGLVAALVGSWGYIIYDKNKTKEAIDQKEVVIASTSTQRDQLQKELQDAAMRYDELKTTNSQKDSAIFSKDKEISKKDKEIAEKKSRIQQLLSKANASQSELAEAKSLIKSLNVDIDSYKQQVTVLQKQNAQLTIEKETVTKERDQVKRNLDSTASVVKEKENVIDIGSTLHASNFNIIGINEKRNGKEKETTTAKRVDKLRISFDLDENLIAKSGTKDIYVCMTAPSGQPITVAALGSGMFTVRGGGEKPYTQKIQINYTQNKRQTISFDWKQNSNYEQGTYKIEVYNNGYKVGEGSKELKKGGLFS